MRAIGSKVTAGRIMGATAVALAVYSVVALLALGRADHFREGAAMFAVFAAGFGGLAWLAIPRRPDNRAVWVPAWSSLLVGLASAGWATGVWVSGAAGLDTSAAGWLALTPSDVPLAAAIGHLFVNIGALAGFFLMLTLWPLLFPDGRLLSPRWRWVAWSAATIVALTTAGLVWLARPSSTLPFGATPAEDPEVGAAVEMLYLLVIGVSLVCVASLFIGHRRSSGEARLQYRWVLLGTAALLFAMFVVDPDPLLILAALAGISISVVSYGVAVTKHRLYDIDVFISRTVVYGTLAAFIGSVYVLVVVVVGGFVGSTAGSLALAIVATALVAVAFEPVRRRAQRWANRLVYGRRATPYEVLADLTRRLAGTEPAEGMLTRMARLMAEGTGAQQATVWLADPDGRLTAGAGWPHLPESARAESMERLTGFTSEVRHDGRLIGALEVIKGRANPVTPIERRLIADLAGSAGLILGNQRLNASLAARAEELQRSRRRLVELQDAERRRLERDLHDGAQQQVVALKLKIGLAEHLSKKQGAEVLAGELEDLADEAQTALDEIRTLAKGIYPPLLESEALPAAIRAQAANSTIPVEIDADDLGRYSKDVESALYFAAVEAMANAAKHAAVTRVRVSLRATDETLVLEVSDDGDGFDDARVPEGQGLVNVRDRVEALDGEMLLASAPGRGTTLSVRIPVDHDEQRVLDPVPTLSA